MTRALIAIAMLAGCRVTPPVATAADAERGRVELVELQQGRALLVRKCGNCHKPPLPGDQAVAAWPARLDEMAPRSSVDATERRLIEQYLIVMHP